MVKRRIRTRERGVAVFVVVLVITLLTAVGLFAARAASLANVAAGNDRQGVQTLYFADYAGRAAITHLGAGDASLFVAKMQTSTDQCEVNRLAPTTTRLPCFKIYNTEIENQIGNGFRMIQPQTALTAGSFGPALHFNATNDASQLNYGLDGAFVVELTEPFDGLPPPGFSVADTQFRAVRVTLTAYAQIRTLPGGTTGTNWCSEINSSNAASIQAVRAHVTLPMVTR